MYAIRTIENRKDHVLVEARPDAKGWCEQPSVPNLRGWLENQGVPSAAILNIAESHKGGFDIQISNDQKVIDLSLKLMFPAEREIRRELAEFN